MQASSAPSGEVRHGQEQACEGKGNGKKFEKKQWEGANGADLALLDVEGVDVVVASKHVGCYDPQMMRTLGAEPKERKAIVVKLGYLEPEIRAIAKRSMMALTTGSSDELFRTASLQEPAQAHLPFGQGCSRPSWN